MLEKNEIHALIQLLEDPDENIYDHVSAKIVELGVPIIADLEQAWETTIDSFYQKRIEQIIDKIQKKNLEEKLKLWLTKNSNDLIQGATLLAKFQYPDIDVAYVKKEIETIKQSIWLELRENLTPMEKVNTFNQIFYNEFGFGGNLKNVFNPNNNFIHLCLERKKGSPIMLGIIYLAIAQQLRLPIFGVDLPFHFALAYCKFKYNEDMAIIPSGSQQVIFYINPISKGLLFSRSDIQDYLTRMNVKPKRSHFTPIENRETVYSLFKHLKACYINNNEAEKVTDVQRLMDLFNETNNE